MALISTLRLGVFGTTILFSIIVLGLSAHITSKTKEELDTVVAAEGLAIATAAITLVSVPAMLIIDMIRRGAVSSLVVAELAGLGLLWVLWLATGADSVAEFNADFPEGCDVLSLEFRGPGVREVQDLCRELQAVSAFGFLNWLMLVGYWSVLLVCSIVAANRGESRIWFTPVGETDFLSNGGTPHTTTSQKMVPMQSGTGYGGQHV
ncbi:hypothetical protein D9758_009249 [Tetrapyrgos nigripes]|uniref:MARVEL domain-containing protein n=1 Tax=Tetrapyrgos nigripes TaxID=182062 RepID=A0A8H5D4J9_9AGAR|nr:hypothetical protein D9758_009249 [Tetrapyrgos nigripes]